MDVYDFDGTLYRGDSTADFVAWCARRHPRVLAGLPMTGAAAVACLGLHVLDKTQFKRVLYRFLKLLPDVDYELERFWRAHEHNLQGPCNPRPGDLVVSASPEFLLGSMCAKRSLGLIASQVDPHTGAVLGPNCSGQEKVARFRELYPTETIERFYSDSRNDDPLANLAQEAYLVNIPKGTLAPWPR